jgi:hypothetical protein
MAGVLLSLICLVQQLGTTCAGCQESISLWAYESSCTEGCHDHGCGSDRVRHGENDNNVGGHDDDSSSSKHLCSAVHLLYSQPPAIVILYPPQFSCWLWPIFTSMLDTGALPSQRLSHARSFIESCTSGHRCAWFHLLQI